LLNLTFPAASLRRSGHTRLFKWPGGDLQLHSYDCIISDFAWSFSLFSSKGEGKSAQARYSVMSLDEIKAFPVLDLCKEHCIHWMWATNPMLAQGSG
jgi:N6-adenosine-specific RNA methylase IME4